MNKHNQNSIRYINQNNETKDGTQNNIQDDTQDVIHWGDNLSILRELYKTSEPFIDLIYIDPPFNSNRNYHIQYADADHTASKSKKQTFSDTWRKSKNKNHNHNNDSEQDSKLSNVDAELCELSTFSSTLYDFFIKAGDIILTIDERNYLIMLSVRLYYMHKLLKDSGSLYLHCDPNMSHYVKVVLDIIFGKENYQNEIAWCYKSGGSTRRRFAKKHDTILFYSKSHEKYKFNPIKDKSYIKERFGFKNAQHLLHKDEGGYYTYANARDYWQLDIIGRSSEERLGYPTQKPELLLERIIMASSDVDDVVADFFCGSGTTINVAQKLGRRWYAVDKSCIGLWFLRNRLAKLGVNKLDYKELGVPLSINGALSLYNSDFAKFRSWLVEYVFGGHDAFAGDAGDYSDNSISNSIVSSNIDIQSLFCYVGHIVFTCSVMSGANRAGSVSKKSEQVKFSCLLYVAKPNVTIDENTLNEMLDEELWGLTDDVRLVVHFGEPFTGYIVKSSRFNAPIISTVSIQEIVTGHLPLWFTKFINSTY